MDVQDIDEEQLKALVELFYARVRADPKLGPVFNDAIADWPEHLEKLAAFWSSVMLTSGRYKGNPMIAHLKHVRRITPALFDRWLALWARTPRGIQGRAASHLAAPRPKRLPRGFRLPWFGLTRAL